MNLEHHVAIHVKSNKHRETMTAPLNCDINIDRSYIRHLSEVRALSQQQPLDG
jgi:hypothetical protein